MMNNIMNKRNVPTFPLRNSEIYGNKIIRNGTHIKQKIKLKIHPMIGRIIALTPSPWITSSCEGKIVVAVSSDGTPKNVDGMKSKNICVSAIHIIVIKSVSGVVNLSRKGDDERISTLTRLMCNPGVKPVIVPRMMPTNAGIIIARVIVSIVFIVACIVAIIVSNIELFMHF